MASDGRSFELGQRVVYGTGSAALVGTVRYVGEVKGFRGERVGVELDGAGPHGISTDGQIMGTKYFECDKGHGMFCSPLLLRSATASPRPPSARAESPPWKRESPERDGFDVMHGFKEPTHRASADPRVPLTTSFDRSRFELTTGGSPSPTKGKRSRTKSAVEPRDVQEAFEQGKGGSAGRREKSRQKRTLKEKRARNVTIIGLPPESPTPIHEERLEQHARELRMRREVMELQKEHLKRLIVENRHLADEHGTVIALLAEVEAANAKTQVENSQLKAHLASQTAELAAVQATAARAVQLDEANATLAAENEALRRALNRDSVDISGFFPPPSPEPTHERNQTPDARLSELAARAEAAERKNVGFSRLLERMTTGRLNEEETGEVDRAIQSSPATKAAELGKIAEKWNWHDLDHHVAEKNKLLDAQLGGSVGADPEFSAPSAAGNGDAVDDIAEVRARLKGRFRELLHTSNSLKIRSQVLVREDGQSPPRGNHETPTRIV